jgi:hypothetical protein
MSAQRVAVQHPLYLKGQACKAFTRVASLPHQASGLYSSRNSASGRFVRSAASQSLKSCQATIRKWCSFSIPRKPMEPNAATVPLRRVRRTPLPYKTTWSLGFTSLQTFASTVLAVLVRCRSGREAAIRDQQADQKADIPCPSRGRPRGDFPRTPRFTRNCRRCRRIPRIASWLNSGHQNKACGNHGSDSCTLACHIPCETVASSNPGTAV